MYDLIIIGAGPGGYVAAIKAGQLGAKVLLIEKEAVGGVCLNHGCIPTKALLKNAKLYRDFMHASDFGITVTGEVTFDFKKMVGRKDKVVKELTNGVNYLLKKNKVEVIRGEAFLEAANIVRVNNELYETKKVILATGSSPILPPIDGVEASYKTGALVTSRELLNITKIPQDFVIVGGGVIGVEFATIFALLGSKVTIIEKLPTILPSIDVSIRDAYLKELTALGIKVITDAEVIKVTDKEVTYIVTDDTKKVSTNLTLMAVGTRPNSRAFKNLEIKLNGASVVTNEYLETTVPGVYAIGDLNGKMMLAHTASHEAFVAVNHALGLKTAPMDYSKIPQAIYGLPEIAAVGLTEQDAIESGVKFKTSIFPFSASGKALADNDKRGFIKLIVTEEYGEIIGAHIIWRQATEMISELVLALNLEATTDELASMIHPHPTLAETVGEAALLATGKAIHY